MAESSTSLGKSESEVAALKEALCAQQQLLQKLYNELDVEREASATAASEALSMILRLQGEKAAVKMEANQYKRLAEEKIYHAEEAMGIFEDLIYQKEMEIISLEYQVQASKYKLLSLGCIDVGVCENLVGEVGSQSKLRRNSMPPIPLKFSYQKKGTIEKERSASPDSISKIEGNMNCECNVHILDMEEKLENLAVGDITSYWEQIRKLDERVREIADCKGVKSTNLWNKQRSSSLVSQVSTGSTLDLDPIKEAKTAKSVQIKDLENLMENEASVVPPCSSNVHDVFEVLQTHDSEKGCVGWTKPMTNLISEGNERLPKPSSVPKDAVKSYVKDESNWVNKVQASTHHKNSLSGPCNEVAVDCHVASVHPTTIGIAESHSKFQQLNKTSEIIEVERDAARPETTTNGVEEELKLLREIQEKLNSIESEIRSWKTIESSLSYELPLLSITEAMLHFWL